MSKKKSNHPFHNGNEAKFLNSLYRGNVWSRSQVKHTFKLANPSAALIRFEEKGYSIDRYYAYSKKAKAWTIRYRLASF